MAIQDMPVGENEHTPLLHAPVEQESVLDINEDNDNVTAVQAAFLDNYVNGPPVSQSFFDHKNSNRMYEAAYELARRKAEADSEAVQEEVLLNPESIAGDIESTLDRKSVV